MTKKFNNSVVKQGVNSKQWLKCAGVRAVKTMAQTFVATVGTATMISQVDWRVIISTSILAGIVSVMTSIAGIPEVPNEKK